MKTSRFLPIQYKSDEKLGVKYIESCSQTSFPRLLPNKPTKEVCRGGGGTKGSRLMSEKNRPLLCLSIIHGTMILQNKQGKQWKTKDERRHIWAEYHLLSSKNNGVQKGKRTPKPDNAKGGPESQRRRYLDILGRLLPYCIFQLLRAELLFLTAHQG